MASPKVHINHKTAAKLLRSQFRAETNALAAALTEAANEAADGEAFMHPYTTDRSAAGVTVPTIAQIRDGALTRAAGSLGLEVRSKP